MTQTYYAVLTEVGEAKLANATALGTPLQLTRMAVGDGGGSVPVPTRTAKNLVGESYRANLNTLQKDPLNGSQVIAELVLPETVGGWWIREIGLFDAAGDLIAYSNAPETYKPQMAEGSARTQVVRMVLLVSSVAAVELKVDPSVVLATREFVTTTVAAELAKLDAKQSVRYATTGNVVLSGLAVQANGDWPSALSAGDRILVKNQSSAKDNGLWAASSGAWTRTADADIDAKVTPALTVSVESGTTLADTVWQLVTDAPIVVGTTALAFQDITNGLARLASPAFTGNPTAPTPAQFDNDTSLATTAFVQRALGSLRTLGTTNISTTMTTAHMGGLYSFYGSATGQTVTLPDATSFPTGVSVWFVNQSSQAVTLAGNGSAVISGNKPGTFSAAAPTLVVGSGDSLMLSYNGGGQWNTFGYSTLRQFPALLAPNGYQMYPSGVLEQWGVAASLAAGETRTVTFPIAFPAGVRSPVLTGDGANPQVRVAALGTATFQIQNLGTALQNCYWRAIGY
ncbi:phage tail protein [Metapseudomonas otitidis]|uniref:phage tail protein n=1 Tax=Metapseudomonas otitidis TaxID=319939 RepID=UPI0013F621F5|nr:phage tail protein [Pseudomonas otitidis]